jgi:hypothetical protein
MRGGSEVTSGERRSRESGFALILAILALMLLTFLGLTLATTTSTELQISNNYRWGQQALYNAEAGLEVARAVLAQVGDGQLVLPPARAGITWNPDALTAPVTAFNGWSFAAARNGENAFCDTWGNGMGFGQVLVDPANPGAPFENVQNPFGVPGEGLTGTFTVWVRRGIVMASGPAFSDNLGGETVIVTAEGAAPFTADSAFAQRNRAIRRLESSVTLREGCRPANAQTSSTGFSDCELL